MGEGWYWNECCSVSVCYSVDGGDAGHELALPLDIDAAVHIRVPVGESSSIESVASLGDKRNVDDVLEIAIGGG